MTRSAKPAVRKKRAPTFAPVQTQIDESSDLPDISDDQLIDRPDGFYWRSLDGKQEFGPFETLELARADLEASDVAESSSIEALQEAESEIGVADWIDPDTGEPAEGLSAPHLSDD